MSNNTLVIGIIFMFFFFSVINEGYLLFQEDFKNSTIKNKSHFVNIISWNSTKTQETAMGVSALSKYDLTIKGMENSRLNKVIYYSIDYFGFVLSEVTGWCFEFGYFEGYKYNPGALYLGSLVLLYLVVIFESGPFVVGTFLIIFLLGKKSWDVYKKWKKKRERR